jgi:uncharacterized membrane protein YkoI
MYLNKNRAPKILIIMGLLTIFFMSGNSLFAQHKKYTSSDMPPAVIESFNKAYPNAQAVGYDIEKEQGSKFYEIESKEGSIKRDILFNEDGTINEVEESMNVSDLSQDAVNTIENKYPGSKILKAEKITKNNETFYEVIVKSKKKTYEVQLKTDGTIINNENNNEENEE